MNRLDGKVAFLSGAARGIGGATARLMASVGAKVAIGDVLDERGRQTAKEIEAVVKQLQLEIARAQPMVSNLNTATANAAAASAHVNNIVAALDNPATLEDLRQTTANAAQLSAKLDAVGGDVAQLTADPAFMQALRNVTIGLGELFAEVYPAETGFSSR